MFDIFFNQNVKPVSESKKNNIKKDPEVQTKYSDVGNVPGRRRSPNQLREDRKKEIEDVLKNERIRNIKYKKTPFKTTMQIDYFKEGCDTEDCEENMIKDAKDKINKKKNKLMKKLKAKKNTKKALVAECIYKMFNESLGLIVNTGTDYEMMKRNLVESFVTSKNVDTLLEQMKETSLPLYDLASLCEEYTEKVFQEVCDDDYVINNMEKDNFYASLKNINTGDISDLVKTRVMSAIEDFTQENRNLKADLEDNLKQAQDKIAQSDSSDVNESFELQAKRKNTIRVDNTTKNIFHCMVENISRATLDNDEMKCYTEAESGRLDMVKIVENTKVMYTFMELLNTSKLEKINEAYVKDALNSLK